MGGRAEPAILQREILRALNDTFARRNWGHRGFLTATRRLSVDEASWRPADGAHTIWQQINHVAYWKRFVLDRLRGRRVRAAQAWPAGGRTVADLRRTLAGCAALHRALRGVVARLAPETLATRRGGQHSHAGLLLGALAHESYHIGQIMQLRKRYRREARRRAGRPASR